MHKFSAGLAGKCRRDVLTNKWRLTCPESLELTCWCSNGTTKVGPLKMCFPSCWKKREYPAVHGGKKKKNPEKEHVVFIVKEETGWT